MAWEGVRGLPLRLCLRHFPIASRRPRSPVLHAAAEACAAQREDSFWQFVDALFADRGRTDDPHLWERVGELGLELERFERDRRTAAIAERVRRDFDSGIRAGVTGTPTAWAGGELVATDVVARVRQIAGL